MKKKFIDANTLQQLSFKLAKLIVDSNYRPTFLIGVWRGGTPIAITVHEVLDYCGIHTDHISVRLSSYFGIDQQSPDIKIHDLTYIKENITEDDRILIVDDIHDTGLSMAKLLDEIEKETNPCAIKTAVIYHKPSKSKVDFKPDFYIHKTSEWLVFPHELVGLTIDELINKKPGIEDLSPLINHK